MVTVIEGTTVKIQSAGKADLGRVGPIRKPRLKIAVLERLQIGLRAARRVRSVCLVRGEVDARAVFGGVRSRAPRSP